MGKVDNAKGDERTEYYFKRLEYWNEQLKANRKHPFYSQETFKRAQADVKKNFKK